MAVTGAIFNSLSFGGVNSADYGIYITGEAVFNAPKRAVEMVSVPGRNGSIAIDQGHWENLEVTYPAGTFGMDESEFATALSNFRNAIVSQIGYQRLTDTYHPDEYRMALYADGLEAEPTTYNSAGEFELKFNCKPQRWLTSGETPVTVTSGDTLTNPTRYGASPLLAVEGYGNINFNGFDIEIENAVMGEVNLSTTNNILNYSNSLLNSGDLISVAPSTLTFSIRPRSASSSVLSVSLAKNTSETSDFEIDGYTGSEPTASGSVTTTIQLPAFDFTAGTTTERNAYYYASARWKNSNGTIATERFEFTIRMRSVRYTSDSQIAASIRDISPTSTSNLQFLNGSGKLGAVKIDSTKSILGDPTYIDLDIGEAYLIENDKLVSLNAYIALGSDLATLAPGANEITFDNTITNFKITPRWWKL